MSNRLSEITILHGLTKSAAGDNIIEAISGDLPDTEVQNILNMEFEVSLIKLNSEFIRSYAPGTPNGEKLKKYIGTFLSADYQRMKDKSADEKYAYFFNGEFKDLVSLKIGSQDGGLSLYWRRNAIDEHGYRGAFYSGTGVWRMELDPKYWIDSSEAERKSLLFHELEHVVSSLVASYHNTSQVSKDATPTSSSSFGQYAGEKLSNNVDQRDFYSSAFKISSVPKPYIQDIGAYVPINWGWGYRRDEQRAVLRGYLRSRGGIATEEMVRDLCEKKNSAINFPWKSKSQEEKARFVKSFEDYGFRLDVLIYLDCSNPGDTVEAINGIARSDVQGEPSDRSRNISALASVARAEIESAAIYEY
jgi:hypothetical protein